MSAQPLMIVRGLTKRFGGLLAVDGVDFELFPGEILALIGPNGAGKTTVFNLLGGVFEPTSGSVVFGRERLDGMPVHRIAERGLLRTFQHNMPFAGLSLTENIQVGRHTRFTGSLLDVLLGRAHTRAEEDEALRRAVELIAFVGLSERSTSEVSTLSFGEGRLLELARALAGDPQAILLDEPAAGLTPAEMGRLVGLIRAIAARGIAILLIEHDMHFLLPLAQRVVVLNFGRKIAQGTPLEITRDAAVVEAYLGEAASGFAQTLRHA